ncbi:nucleoside deaminase [Leptospira sp. 2 VSF19]|uniref:Nucleoside deaminase n=1 Tax=Leptospira soteropolitanensis TaxID=2950025 RepID=A0AAW5VBU2_9LEPT|nr:nucleoside deaminase [Leptospira soteropolitanensis]MCW7491531.1 nucleoside deaminase [Leptospira soteropolitanensis]MCW7499115.1 nucleoside deaminase [Leptospira soteropolitanensis]MCW7521293.1 nucleoside deaminase [Leptospira soteropolitanensis]MCW7525219.1 nucleoside deaminase [Leptospira soteropolitanensis]MCW7529086.1 nucleoside deaminase [Leptospira soteropolitanensis]
MEAFESFLERYQKAISSHPEEIPSYSEIITRDGNLVSAAFNSVEQTLNPTKHSEILAMEEALSKTEGRYLSNHILITALEPCLLCAGAILRVKIPEVVYFVPAKPGEGISSYTTESIYLLNHFPKCTLIPKSHIKFEFLSFFKEKR